MPAKGVMNKAIDVMERDERRIWSLKPSLDNSGEAAILLHIKDIRGASWRSSWEGAEIMGRAIRTVLLVDGSATMLYYHGILLKRLEYAVLTAGSAEEALKIMERTVPSLVLTAISMPAMGGTDFIKKMKGSDRTSAVPVIVITAEEDAATRSACLGMGCAAYLIKPVEPDQLFRTIQAATEPTPRANIRLSTSLKAVVGEGTGQSGAERTEYATTISEGGLYLRTLSPHPKNALIPVRIFIKDREIRAKAVVLYSHALEEGTFREPGMGMKFIEISEEDRDFLRSFIKEQLTSDIMPGS
jgi:CheY-like chemotaxis protein